MILKVSWTLKNKQLPWIEKLILYSFAISLYPEKFHLQFPWLSKSNFSFHYHANQQEKHWPEQSAGLSIHWSQTNHVLDFSIVVNHKTKTYITKTSCKCHDLHICVTFCDTTNVPFSCWHHHITTLPYRACDFGILMICYVNRWIWPFVFGIVNSMNSSLFKNHN